MSPDQVICEICRIVDEDASAQAYLYGSRAQGHARARSDFDIAVENAADFDALCTAVEDIPTLYKIDVLDLDHCRNDALRADVREHGYDVHEALG